jgi:hypothetical protein
LRVEWLGMEIQAPGIQIVPVEPRHRTLSLARPLTDVRLLVQLP